MRKYKSKDLVSIYTSRRSSYCLSCLTYDPKDEKTQQVSRTYQDIASTYSPSHAVREVNFVDPSVSAEDELRFLCGFQQNQNRSLPDLAIKKAYFSTET